MQEGALFDPRILGSNFIWWMGQIADDSVWRDNILPGKFKTAEDIPGWEFRYKVRIMGLHDQGQDVIAEEDLPWASIMYPVTAGGGQTNSWMTSNLRQGNFVFGFFMDGQSMQVPIIMGVLGNNSQTPLGMKIGKPDNSVTNTQPGNLARSGYATGQVPKKGTTKERVPDTGLVVEKPKKQEIAQESAASPPGTTFNQYGLPDNRPVTQTQQNDIASAKLEASEQGLSGDASSEFVKGKVEEGIKNRAAAANAPDAPAEPGVTQEHPGAMHQQAAADVKKEDKYREKTVLLKPGHIVESATKAIQTETDNITAKVDKFLGSKANFIDAVSGPPSRDELDKEVKKAADNMAKYQKIIMDKIGEYQLKKLNNELTKTVAQLPSSLRSVFGDQKFLNTENTLKQYNEITNKLPGQLKGILSSALQIDKLEKEVDDQISSGALWADPNSQAASEAVLANDSGKPPLLEKDKVRHPVVPVCYAEDIVAQAIVANKDAIMNLTSSTHKNYDSWISSVQGELEEAEQELKDRAYDRTNLGKVLEISDEEEDDLPIGGTNYYTENGAPVTGGSGTGLMVNIIVPSGGWYDNGFATLNEGGAGYTVNTANGGGVSGTGSTTGATTTGGSGSGIKVNYTISSGVITGITTSAGNNGSSYKNGDVLTIVNNASGTPSTNSTFTLDKIRGTVDTVENGGITISKTGSGYKMGDLLIVSQSGSGQDCGIMVAMIMDPGEKKATSGPVTPGDTAGSVADAISEVGQKLGSIMSLLPSMPGSITEALDFANIKTNMFPFESPPNLAVSDFYSLARGGASQGDTQVPSVQAIGKAALKDRQLPLSIPDIPFAEPTKGMPDIDLKSLSSKVNSTREAFQNLTEKEANQLMKKASAKVKDVFDT